MTDSIDFIKIYFDLLESLKIMRATEDKFLEVMDDIWHLMPKEDRDVIREKVKNEKN